MGAMASAAHLFHAKLLLQIPQVHRVGRAAAHSQQRAGIQVLAPLVRCRRWRPWHRPCFPRRQWHSLYATMLPHEAQLMFCFKTALLQ